MSNNSVAQTRDAVFKDVDALRNDASKLVTDVKNHATAHVDAKRQLVNDTYRQMREQALAHPFALLGIGFALGALFGWRARR